MKICFLLNNEFIWDNRVYREACTLVEAGHQVVLLCARDQGKTLPEREIIKGIEIHRVFSKRLRKYQPFTRRHMSAFIKILWGYSGFDVVHAHDVDMLLLGWGLARCWRAKLVYDSHELWDSVFQSRLTLVSKTSESLQNSPSRHQDGLDYQLAKRQIRSQTKQIKWLKEMFHLEVWLLQRVDALISVNETLVKKIAAKTQGQIKYQCIIRNIPNYYVRSASQRRFHKHFNLSQEQAVILYQGGIQKSRGIDHLLMAMQDLHALPVTLVLMGPIMEEGYETELRQVIESSILKGRVFLKSTVPENELLDWTSSADLGLAPILNVRESYYYCLPNKLFEYIQAEIPVGVSNFPEMSQLVANYNIGFTYDPQNPAEIAKSVNTFFSNTGKREFYLQNVRRAKEVLTWENEQKKLIELYKALEPIR